MPEAVHYETKLEGTSATKREVEGEFDVEAATDIDHGDYAARLEEVLGQEDEEEEEEFLYQGEDSQEASGTYNEQLRDVLRELDNDAPGIDLQEEREVESHLEGKDAYIDDEAPGVEVQSNYMTSIPPSPSDSPLGATPTTINASPRIHLTKAFLHPSISRLRSFNPHSQPASPSPETLDAYQSPSHFSAMSRTPSISNGQRTPEISRDQREEREAFRWTVLRDIGRWLYMDKAASTLGSFHGHPTVLAANGLICVGTDRGRVLVFNFKQQLMCVCGTDDLSELAGPVSALSLSHDHTYIAVGYARGHINLFELSRPQAPVRTVLPTSLPAVLSGRKEGHLEETRILNLAFVGSRHTAIVSADESGLSFYHSLGKVLFIEASDTIRILGKYPEATDDTLPPRPGTNGTRSSSSHTNEGGAIPSTPRSRSWGRPKGNTILAMASLPLGTAAHPTEAYGLTALLTPAKLVIVGLTPSPRTWLRCHRDSGVSSGASKWRGCLAWFPSVDPAAVEVHNTEAVGHHSNGKQIKHPKNSATRPVLAYTWDRSLHLLRVSETKVRRTVHSTKNPGKSVSVEVNKIVVEEVAVCSSDSDFLAIQWLNAHQLLTLTLSHLEVWDVRTLQRVEHTPFRANTLLPCTDSGEIPEGGLIAHSTRVYKGKIFLLGLNEMKVGILLTWADRILAFVEEGDFLSAIETARSYLLGTAPGNRIGLPDEPSALRSLVGNRMRDLMTASTRYAFADERMTDDTHVTPDGRGVDRTELFEGLVTVCTKACIALNDFDFLFETLFEEYDNACIAHIFLERLEPFVLDGTLRTIPPRISQRLIGHHEDRGDLENAERLIWHVDPECLDINQAVTLCQKNKLYDALLYVYTCSLHDFVAPLVELLGLVRRVRKIQHHRASRLEILDSASTFSMTSLQSVENMVSDGYKIYSYLEDILSGLSYPNQAPMPSDESSRAKRDVYEFLFKGLSYTHIGLDGKSILLSAEEGEVEQTYPYVRLLLQFDAEAFLHVMDIAFEDGYFNEDPPGVDRLVITRILMEILSTPGISSSEATMLNIFIARNVPKYPQSIYMYMAPSTLHSILVSLAQDPDPDTREDRQLAAEYLLSVYTPHNSEKMIRLFDDAKFFRILRSWYRQENKLEPLISTYLRDPDIGTDDKFHSIDDILTNASYLRNRTPPEDVLEAILGSVPRLLDSSIMDTAILMDKHAPNLHSRVLETLENDKQKYAYLRCLLEPSASPEEYHLMQPVLQQRDPSCNLDPSFKELYLNLLCKFNTNGILSWLNGLKEGHLDWDTVVSVCEKNRVYDAVIWTLDKQGDVKNAFQRLEDVSEYLASELGDLFSSESEYGKDGRDVQHLSGNLTAVGNMGLRICQHYSTAGVDVGGLTAEDMWFRLLSSQIDTVQTVSGYYSMGAGHEEPKGSQEHQTLESLRLLVQTTFASLLALGSSPVLSFPRLFRRLVESTSRSRSSSRSSYSEFRTILTGMLDSYRNEGDLLLITNHLVRRDLFTVVEELSRCSSRGSRVRGPLCAVCKETLPVKRSTAVDPSPIAKVDEWMIQRSTGFPYHRQCLPSIDPS